MNDLELKSKLEAVPLNYYISPNFKYSDLICPCCNMIDIVPGVYRHVAMMEVLQAECGFGLTILSGYRCKRYNKRVGGAPRSWHLLFATDVMGEDPEMLKEIYVKSREIGFGGIGLYDGSYVHLDIRPEKMRWRA